MDMHRLANRVTLEELKAAGILRGNVDDMMKVRADDRGGGEWRETGERGDGGTGMAGRV